MHMEQFTTANGDRMEAPNVAIVLTDGVSNVDKQNTIPAANAAKTDGITIIRYVSKEVLIFQE